jgi:hypothetical protein
MDKKKLLKNNESDDIRGFEEFIESHLSESQFLPRAVGGNVKKNEAGFEHFTFLMNDSQRLNKLKNLVSTRLPFSAKFDQGPKLIKEQEEELEVLKVKLFELSQAQDSPYRKSLAEIFDSYFGPPKT